MPILEFTHWRWRHHVHLKCQHLSTKLYDVTTQKTTIKIKPYFKFLSCVWKIQLHLLWGWISEDVYIFCPPFTSAVPSKGKNMYSVQQMGSWMAWQCFLQTKLIIHVTKTYNKMQKIPVRSWRKITYLTLVYFNPKRGHKFASYFQNYETQLFPSHKAKDHIILKLRKNKKR
jgi:hypothetical protein